MSSRLLLNIAYEHLRGGRQHAAECVPAKPSADCPLCDFEQRLEEPVLKSEVAEEARILAMVELVNRMRAQSQGGAG